MKKYILSSLLFFLWFANTAAQSSKNISQEPSLMEKSGKIYVVAGVMAIIFTGLSIYMFILDKRISKIEDTLKKYR